MGGMRVVVKPIRLHRICLQNILSTSFSTYFNACDSKNDTSSLLLPSPQLRSQPRGSLEGQTNNNNSRKNNNNSKKHQNACVTTQPQSSTSTKTTTKRQTPDFHPNPRHYLTKTPLVEIEVMKSPKSSSLNLADQAKEQQGGGTSPADLGGDMFQWEGMCVHLCYAVVEGWIVGGCIDERARLFRPALVPLSSSSSLEASLRTLWSHTVGYISSTLQPGEQNKQNNIPGGAGGLTVCVAAMSPITSAELSAWGAIFQSMDLQEAGSAETKTETKSETNTDIKLNGALLFSCKIAASAPMLELLRVSGGSQPEVEAYHSPLTLTLETGTGTTGTGSGTTLLLSSLAPPPAVAPLSSFSLLLTVEAAGVEAVSNLLASLSGVFVPKKRKDGVTNNSLGLGLSAICRRVARQWSALGQLSGLLFTPEEGMRTAADGRRFRANVGSPGQPPVHFLGVMQMCEMLECLGMVGKKKLSLDSDYSSHQHHQHQNNPGASSSNPSRVMNASACNAKAGGGGARNSDSSSRKKSSHAARR